MPKYELDGRTVLITGSTGGLGTAVARALRRRGANLALLDLDADLAQRQAADLGPETVARGWAADVRDLDSLRAAVDAAAEHFGRIDVVIANAGIGAVAPIETMDPEAFERIIDINLNGVWRTFRTGLPHVKQTGGYMLAVSSMAAFVHSPLNGPYVASKAGAWALCDAFRLEVRHYGVGVGSVHPTFFQTPMMDDVHADPAATRLWGGNRNGLWKTIPLDTVVNSVVSGVERRADLVVPTRRNALVARIPGLVRPIIDRIGFRGTTIPDAIAQASPSGWSQPR
ncbi:SDR family NAD(P)-dependent oxidoreductase [Antrihabitans sp. YC2-6]|uniref:SDR family NAD(P)-dependent oxidoreductase n=1 Tax=Antrihabitans sp. YC2-6 TaxID=2799498 RepID=UPI0018F50E0E|nr:SDR family NAD(P)-dependent oxidoreductase [Antrihabitans sp. YC2-6]MBJ8346962.1 SDR family NAD(P)-dependent oxidoreductase [Antrihabitans sp. YC2-6]